MFQFYAAIRDACKCHTPHKFGFVAQLKDKSVSIVGNVCAEVRFGIDSNISKDAKAYFEEQARLEKLERLNELLKDEESHMQELVEMLQDLDRSSKMVHTYYDQLPQRVLEILEYRGKNRNTAVSVTSITHHLHVDEDGYEDRETRKRSHTLGYLKGLGVLDSYYFFKIRQDISDIKNAYREAHELDEEVKSTELEAIAAKIAEVSNVAKTHKVFKRELKEIFEIEPLLLCYLVNSKSDRFKVAKFALELSGNSVGRDKAKSWLLEKDLELKKSLKADSISIEEY